MMGLIAGYLYGKQKGRAQAEEAMTYSAMDIAEMEKARERKKIRRASRGAVLLVLILLCWVFYSLGVGGTTSADEAGAKAASRYSYDQGGARVDNVSCRHSSKSEGYLCRVRSRQKIGPNGYGIEPCIIYRVAGDPSVATKRRTCG